MKIGIVLTTVSNLKDAKRLAYICLRSKNTACVSIIPQARSIYRWKKKIEEQKELVLIFKTTLANLNSLQEVIKFSHPYELPEIIAVRVCASSEYARWVSSFRNV
ncbi:hypothetical protein B9J78_05050 [bacterium Unc6]|nr:hypothetical protein [bacterium Unc6]